MLDCALVRHQYSGNTLVHTPPFQRSQRVSDLLPRQPLADLVSPYAHCLMLKLDPKVWRRSIEPAKHFVHNSNMIGASLLVWTHRRKPTERFLGNEPAGRAMDDPPQMPNGAWHYCEGPMFRWVDSFHTGYVLEALDTFIRSSGDAEFSSESGQGLPFLHRDVLRRRW